MRDPKLAHILVSVTLRSRTLPPLFSASTWSTQKYSDHDQTQFPPSSDMIVTGRYAPHESTNAWICAQNMCIRHWRHQAPPILRPSKRRRVPHVSRVPTLPWIRLRLPEEVLLHLMQHDLKSIFLYNKRTKSLAIYITAALKRRREHKIFGVNTTAWCWFSQLRFPGHSHSSTPAPFSPSPSGPTPLPSPGHSDPSPLPLYFQSLAAAILFHLIRAV